MSMLIIDIETTGLKLSNHRITVIGTICYDPKTKKIEKDEVFNVIKNEVDGNVNEIIDIKQTIFKLLMHSTCIVAFNGINFDMPFIFKWLKEAPCLEINDLLPIIDKKYLDFCAISKKYTNCYISLNNMCLLNKINVSKSSNGAQAVIWAKEKNWEALSEYCLQDVYVLMQLTQHAIEHGLYFSKTRIINDVMPSDTMLMYFDATFQPMHAFDTLLVMTKSYKDILKVDHDNVFV